MRIALTTLIWTKNCTIVTYPESWNYATTYLSHCIHLFGIKHLSGAIYVTLDSTNFNNLSGDIQLSGRIIKVYTSKNNELTDVLKRFSFFLSQKSNNE